MTDFRGNIDHWLRQSEPDYFLFFLKAWIPFNAWYVAELPHLNKKDTLIIKELQDNPKSRPRLIIENFLTSSNNHSAKQFKAHLAELHYNLETKTLKHDGNKLTFTNLSLTENPKKFEKFSDKRGNIYKAEVKSGYYEAIIVEKGGKTILHFKQPIYKFSDLEKNIDFIRIKEKKIRTTIKSCFQAIDPSKPISIISPSKSKTESILLSSQNSVYLINDPTTIAKGCIKTLYTLRCMLFHGEVEPTPSYRPIYEHAYYLLRLILKEL